MNVRFRFFLVADDERPLWFYSWSRTMNVRSGFFLVADDERPLWFFPGRGR
jgi:hypothetical protein